jgi:hypothetical protein
MFNESQISTFAKGLPDSVIQAGILSGQLSNFNFCQRHPFGSNFHFRQTHPFGTIFKFLINFGNWFIQLF